MHRTVVLNVVGLTRSLLEHLPSLRALGTPTTIGHVTPAVTCSVQATYLTGALPREHGIVGNGWYFRDECEVRFWHQSDKLVQKPRIWDIARLRDPAFTCANIFWWHAMYSQADITVTPRPMYPADGRKIPDLWTHPSQLRAELQAKFGPFPLFKFWGPATSIESTDWIAKAAIDVDERFQPTLSLVYVPHLDYVLQKHGPASQQAARDARELDGVLRRLLEHFSKRAKVIVLSEYGIEAVSRPVHLNRALREHGFLAIREELGRELLDAGASAAFAVADHQVAHIYVNDPEKLDAVADLLRRTPGVDQVLDRAGQREFGIDHPRAGDLVVLAEQGAWFTYYYWQDDSRAPDFARTVDIHRKPGYDPVELFTDASNLAIGWKLAKRKLGMRGLLDVIPLDAMLVRGSHGRKPSSNEQAPICLTSENGIIQVPSIPPTEVAELILRHIGI